MTTIFLSSPLFRLCSSLFLFLSDGIFESELNKIREYVL